MAPPPAIRDLFLGTSGWAYPSWKPGFYPAGVPQKKMLEFYATQLNSVEVNFTFRQLPSPSTLANWLAAVGEGFRFSFKAPQRITHMQRLRASQETFAAFVESLKPAAEAGRLGLLLFQLPPNFKADRERLASFLDMATPCGWKLAFEFRHESWFAEEMYAELRAHGAALCVAENDDLRTPDVATAAFACYRLRKEGGYTPAELRSLESMLRARSHQGEVYGYFKHEDEPTGALQAAQTLRNLRGL